MQEAVILVDEKLKKFCKELNIDSNGSKILIKINGNRAEYYSFEDDCFFELDLEIAKKYSEESID